MKRLWICLLAFALLTGCGDSGDIAVTTVYETDDPPRTALTTEWETYDPSVETVWCILSYEGGRGISGVWGALLAGCAGGGRQLDPGAPG